MAYIMAKTYMTTVDAEIEISEYEMHLRYLLCMGKYIFEDSPDV